MKFFRRNRNDDIKPLVGTFTAEEIDRLRSSNGEIINRLESVEHALGICDNQVRGIHKGSDYSYINCRQCNSLRVSGKDPIKPRGWNVIVNNDPKKIAEAVTKRLSDEKCECGCGRGRL